MLVELFEIERGLAAAGVLPPVRHSDIHRLGKRAVLRARLGGQGIITAVELLKGEDANKFWTLRDGNHNSFPLVPIGSRTDRRPLRRGADQELLKTLAGKGSTPASRLDAFRKLRRTSPLRLEGMIPWPSYRARLLERQNALQALSSTEAKAVTILLQRILSGDGMELLKSLDSALGRAIEDTPNPTFVDLAGQILFAGAGEVLLDVDLNEGFSQTACDPRNIDEITKALNLSRTDIGAARCALSGHIAPIEEDKFPQPNLPLVGPTYLYSKNTDVGCARRYGIAGPQGFRVSRELVSRLQAAVEEITSVERMKKTWSRLPSEKPKEYDLLLAFVPAMDTLPVAAGLAENEAAFEELASRLVALYSGRSVGFSEQARFVVLRKVDPGNRKVIFTTTNAVNELAEAAQRWTLGCQNAPGDIHLPILKARGKGVSRQPSGHIAPGNLVALGREIFSQEGKKRYEAPGPTFADVMGLFLGPKRSRTLIATRMLRVFVARRWPSVTGVAHASRRDDLKGFNLEAALKTIRVLAVLLHHIGRRKEVYMNDSAFLLGQLLAGADILHRGFCEHQRNGSIPSALLGNQALALAQRCPVAALSVLCARWRVYAGWAEKVRHSVKKPDDSGPKEDRQRAWAIYRGVVVWWKLRSLAQGLHGASLPERADDRFRAEMLLGYLTGPTGSAPATSASSPTDYTEED